MKNVAALVVLAVTVVGCHVNVVDGGGKDAEVTGETGQALRCAPDDLFTSAIAVCGDFSSAGDVDIEGDLSVGGELSHAGEFNVDGALRLGDAPCGRRGLAVSAAVHIAKNDHDDHSVSMIDGSMVLGDGRSYFGDASFIGKTDIHVNGHASMFVDGDVDAVGDGTIFVEPGASLDLYISGSLSTAGSFVAAGCDPSSFRIFVGGRGSIIAGAGETELRGFLYAPDAEVQLAGDARITGAVVAREISFAGEMHVKGVPSRPRPAEACGRVTASPSVTSGSAGPT